MPSAQHYKLLYLNLATVQIDRWEKQLSYFIFTIIVLAKSRNPMINNKHLKQHLEREQADDSNCIYLHQLVNSNQHGEQLLLAKQWIKENKKRDQLYHQNWKFQVAATCQMLIEHRIYRRNNPAEQAEWALCARKDQSTAKPVNTTHNVKCK